MDAPNPPSLTGSEFAVPATHSAHVSVALGQLRRGVFLTCWFGTLSVFVHIVLWGLASFTGLRWSEVTHAPQQAPLIVSAGDAQQPESRTTLGGPPQEATAEPVNPNRVRSNADRLMGYVAATARAVGTMAILVLTPLVALGVVLAAATATRGVEKAVSAFCWSVLVLLLVLPVSEFVGLPWAGGAFWTYDGLCAFLDHSDTINGYRAPFFGRYLLLPAVCGLGLAITLVRFGAGVEAGLIGKENLHLDPALEQEAGQVKAGSLHGGRAATAMRQVVMAPKPTETEDPPSVRQLSAGQRPKRLI
jgi:hypothetical protein